MLRKSKSMWVILILLSLVPELLGTARAQGGYDPTVQTQTLLYDEARTVYLGNLARRDNGVPPLRWNRQLTHAARWFSWDSTENRPSGFCGHQDSQGHAFNYRTSVFGYLGFAAAENAFCGYVTPEYAIQGWMNSSGHRANLLNPNSREIGLGYYRRSSDGRGYVTQDFGYDAVYAPAIIENEAISTTNPDVNLYIYDRLQGEGFAGLSAATQMMVSNYADFYDATWEPYNANKAWTLVNGDGWREVHVKTRDVFNRTLTTSDTIYLGANVPLNELGAAQMTTTQSQVTIYNLNGGTLPQAQFSLGWLADDTLGTFTKWWGNGERINDAAAWGGTSYRLYPGNGESFAWVYDTTFIKDTPMVAYFRLKVNDNTSSSEVARISVDGGGTEYGPLSLRGTDFTAPNQYQEFALNFTFNTNPNDVFLKFNFWRSGNADLYVDAVSIFTAPLAITSPLTWSVPGNNYRGQGVWVRYTNGSQFSNLSEADTTIEIPPRVISSLRASTNPTNASSVDFTVTFSKPVTGVDMVGPPFDDFALTTSSGLNGGSITSVSGSGMDYIVTVNTGTGDGSIRLDLVDNDTILNETGLKLGGTGIGNGNFNSGETYTIDRTAPTVSSINRAGNDPASTSSVTFTASFSEPVTGVDMVTPFNDFALTTSGVPGAAISGVSGLGNVYTVTVNTGSGDGTIRLDIPDTATINDLAGNTLGGLPYVSGATYTINKPPSAATLTSPTGNIGKDYDPVYTWNKVATASHYRLYVSGPRGLVLDQWYEASKICDDTTCSVTPGPSTTLGGGTYSWYVQTWNPVGYGPWSNNTQPINFSTTVPPIPAAVDLRDALTAPTHGQNLGSNYNPTFTWKKVDTSTYYRLYLAGPAGVVKDQWYPASTICNTSTCSVTDITVGGGAHTWYVDTYNSAGVGPWSAATTFSTTIPTPPAAVDLRDALTSPTHEQNLGTNYNPTFTWKKVNAASWYRLYVAGPAGVVLDQWYQASSICNATSCSVVSPTLGGGTHTWYVLTYNAAGSGPWSLATTFSTTPPTIPAAVDLRDVLTAPIHGQNLGTNYNPTFTWKKVNAASWYRLYVAGPAGVVLDQWYQASSICNATSCSVVSPTLGGGTHTWYVLTYNAAGSGPWSLATTFSTTPPTIPAAVDLRDALTAPTHGQNLGTNYNPTFTWKKVNTASWYRLYVAGPAGVVLDQWYQASSICNATSCSVVSPTFGGGTYTWYVLTYNAAGTGSWSLATTFGTTPPTAPAAAVLTAPTGTITSHTPTYIWNRVNMATWYRLYVKGLGGLVLDHWYQASAICDATTCSVPSPALGSGDHVWWIQPYNSAGYGPWKSATFKVSP